jgi:hypothetical protein
VSSDRSIHDRVRDGFAAITHAPRPELAQRIRDSIWNRVAPPPQPLLLPLPPPVLIAAVLVLTLLTAAIWEGPAIASGAGAIGSRLPHLPTPGPAAARKHPTTSPSIVATPRPSPSPSPSPSAVPTPTPPATPPAPVPAPVSNLPGYVCAEASGGGTMPSAMTTARVGAQAGFDRFVIQFNGPVPQYALRLQASPTFGTTTLRGSAGLDVVLHNASGAGTYGASQDFLPAFTELREARLLSDSQGTVEWALGLAHASCFHAFVLDGPARLVVDVQD